MRIAVIGGTGFIGSEILRAVSSAGHEVTAIPAPRLSSASESLADLVDESRLLGADLSTWLAPFDCVVNAAGISDAVSGDDPRVIGANSLLPGVIAVAARRAGCKRFVHVSSAAVQGRATQLDSSEVYDPTSLYGRSKVLGEQVLTTLDWSGCVIHRPTSVHGTDRAVTRTLTRVARSSLSSVASPGSNNTPQVHVEQVANAVRVLVEADAPPRITLQPSEGFTTASFLEQLGGHTPIVIPRAVCVALVRLAYLVASIDTNRLWGQARRLEMLWFGQGQTAGWLDERSPDLTHHHPAWLAARTSDA